MHSNGRLFCNYVMFATIVLCLLPADAMGHFKPFSNQILFFCIYIYSYVSSTKYLSSHIASAPREHDMIWNRESFVGHHEHEMMWNRESIVGHHEHDMI